MVRPNLGAQPASISRWHKSFFSDLLAIGYFSYCQTIEAYPTGGGSVLEYK